MTDLASQSGPFKDWARGKFAPWFAKVASMINRNVLFGFWLVLDLGQHRSAVSGRIHGTYRDALLLLTAHCFVRVAQEVRAKGLSGPIANVYDQGSPSARWILRAFQRASQDPVRREEFLLSTLTFGDDKHCLPLQAADILAYELYKELPRQAGGALDLRRIWELSRLRRRRRVHIWEKMTLRTLRDIHRGLLKHTKSLCPRSLVRAGAPRSSPGPDLAGRRGHYG